MQIIPVEDCPTTLYMALGMWQQWAKTPAGCQPSGPGWNAPIIGRTEDEWLWCRAYDPVAKSPIVQPLDDTQPIIVDVYAPTPVLLKLAG